MDSFCDNLILAIFQFVCPDDRFRFIMLGKKYYKVVSDHITTPEWIYDQINQFIKKNVVVDFTLRCGDGMSEYNEYVRKHKRDKQQRDNETSDRPPIEFDNTSECSSACDDYGDRVCHVAPNLLAQQLGIGVMICSYDISDSDDYCNCDSCEWIPETPIASDWNLNFIQNAPPNYSTLTDQDYHVYVTDNLQKQPDAKYYAYWSDNDDDDNHVSDLIVVDRDRNIEYTRGDECICGSIVPVHSVYESVGIIVHNMTGIKQICSNLFDYEITHLQLFYIVNFIASTKIPTMLDGSCGEEDLDALLYSLFVEHMLRNCVRKNVDLLMMSKRVDPLKYVFMIHPEIESKAAEAVEHIILFGTE